MRQRNVLAGAVALCLVGAATAAFACDSHKSSAATISAGTETKVEMVSTHGACGTKSSMAHLFKDAPGTKTRFKKVDNGMSLVVTAASKEYVPVVQTALLQHVDEMKLLATQKVGGHCSTEKAGALKVSGSSCGAKAEKVEQASVVSKTSGAGCCAAKAAATKASMQAANTKADCPEWMQVLCDADMQVSKTAEGVVITWTSPKKEMVDQLRAAGEKFHADLAQL